MKMVNNFLSVPHFSGGIFFKIWKIGVFVWVWGVLNGGCVWGQDIFGEQRMISPNTAWPSATYATDLDGDGDNDIVSASEYDRKIAWYEMMVMGILVFSR